jgi:hypothetical protein
MSEFMISVQLEPVPNPAQFWPQPVNVAPLSGLSVSTTAPPGA